MLARHMFGYAPSLIVTGALSLASLSFFTSLLSHTEYGEYSLAINMMTMLVGVCFFWLQSAASRLMPQAVNEGTEAQFSATLYCLFIMSAVVLLIFFGLLAFFLPLGDWRVALVYAPLMAVLRSLLNLNQAFHRSYVRIGRYNIIEAGQAVIGLVSALILIAFLHGGASGAAIGSVIGLSVMALFDWRMLRNARQRNFDWAKFKEIAHFGLPFIANFAFSFVLSGSDRFLIEFYLGPDQVGLYSAGYAFPDRIGQYLFMAVATASFPLLVRRLEREGIEAARDQTYINGIAILALAIPTCIGMLLVNKQIAATLIGVNFRAEAIVIMPWIAIATMLNGVAAHYFDHAFHLAKKTKFFFFILGPAALLNFVGNLYAIPHYGILGAAFTTLAAYALYLILSISFGRHLFRIKFPYKPAIQIVVSTAAMAFALSAFNFPETVFGLISMVALGGSVYGCGMIFFDVMGLRSFLKRRLFGKTEISSLRFNILTSINQVEEISAEWQALHTRVGHGIFGGYDLFQIWWRNLGMSGKTALYIVTARSQSGELVALLPLTIRKTAMVRILEWAGYDVFDFNDALAKNENDATEIWHFIYNHGLYDIALLKDVQTKTLSLPWLSSNLQLREQRKNYFLTLDFPSGEAWLAAQSRKLRGDARRKTEKMETKGAVAFHKYKQGDPFPDNVIDRLYTQKSAWFLSHHASGVFARPETRGFLLDLARNAARQGTLYLAWITCGDDIIACHMGFIREGVLYLYHTTYDAAYGAYSPGNILMIETIKAAIDARLSELDFMRGDESYKTRFAGGARPLAAYVGGRSWLGKIFIQIRSLVNKKTDVIRKDLTEEN